MNAVAEALQVSHASQVFHAPLRLATISRDTLSTRNALSRRRAPMAAHWLAQDWMFELAAGRAAAEAAQCFVEFDWGGARIFVGIARESLDMLARIAMPGAEPTEWPMPVLLAALEFTASALAEIVEAASRKSLRIVSIVERPPIAAMETYRWRAWSREHEIAGDLLLDAAASRFLAAALREQRPVPTDDKWDELPMRLRLVAGWVDLSAGSLRNVERRDVVMLDEWLLGADSRLMVLLGPRLGVPCRLEGSVLRVLEGVQEIMGDVDESVAASSGLIDDVPVRLTFDLGEREISLGDLRSLQPGYLFNLGRDPKSTVNIRANGRLIGDGELVDIEGRVGVSVLNFNLEAR
jgi:type III secretion protein Q